MDAFGILLRHKPHTAMCIDLLRLLAGAQRNAAEVVAQGERRSGSGFGDIDLPFVVERVGQFYGDPGELEVLVLGPAKAQPVAGD